MTLANPVTAPSPAPGRAARVGALLVPGSALLLSTVAIVAVSVADLLQ